MMRNALDRRRFAVWLMGCAAMGLAHGCGEPSREQLWQSVEREIRSGYPGVPAITQDELSLWMERQGQETPLLIDVRKEEEFEVSHLQGAIWGGGDPLFALGDQDRTRPVVVYCSVGVRSAASAYGLQQAGFDSVYNLHGGIFQWANEGKPVFKDGREVGRVHPFNKDWGRLLDSASHPR